MDWHGVVLTAEWADYYRGGTSTHKSEWRLWSFVLKIAFLKCFRIFFFNKGNLSADLPATIYIIFLPWFWKKIKLQCCFYSKIHYQFSSVQSLSHVRLFVTPWIATCQASLSITNSRSSLRLTSIASVTPSSHFILCRPLLLLPQSLPASE